MKKITEIPERATSACGAAAALAMAIAAPAAAQEGLDKTTDEWVTGPAYVAPQKNEKVEKAVLESKERSKIAAQTGQEELFELTEGLDLVADESEPAATDEQ